MSGLGFEVALNGATLPSCVISLEVDSRRWGNTFISCSRSVSLVVACSSGSPWRTTFLDRSCLTLSSSTIFSTCVVVKVLEAVGMAAVLVESTIVEVGEDPDATAAKLRWWQGRFSKVVASFCSTSSMYFFMSLNVFGLLLRGIKPFHDPHCRDAPGLGELMHVYVCLRHAHACALRCTTSRVFSHVSHAHSRLSPNLSYKLVQRCVTRYLCLVFADVFLMVRFDVQSVLIFEFCMVYAPRGCLIRRIFVKFASFDVHWQI